MSAKVDNLATGLSNQIADIQESCISVVGDSWLFLEQGRNMATEALPSKHLVSETVYLLSSRHLTGCIQKQTQNLSV